MTAQTDARVQDDRAEQTVAVHFVDVRTQLNEIAAENETLVFDYETPEGEKSARSQIFKLKKINGAIDEIHKTIKREILVQGRMMDSVKNELRDRVAKMIDVHKKPLDEIAERETKRLDAIDKAIEKITHIPEQIGMSTTLQEALMRLDELLSITVTKEVYQERYVEASKLYDQILDDLETYIRKKRDDEKREKEVEELKAKQAERDRIDREKKIAEEAAAKAIADAEFKAAHEKKVAEEAAIQREFEIRGQLAKAEREKQEAYQRVDKATQLSQKLKARADEAKKNVGTEKRRLLMMFADFIVERAPQFKSAEELVNQFYENYPNIE